MILIWTFGLRTRQHSLCKKDLANAKILRSRYCGLRLHLMQAFDLVWIHLLHCLDANCYFDLVSNALFWVDQGMFHHIHEKTKKTASYGNCLLGCGYLYLMPWSSWCLILLISCWLFPDSKSKGKWVSIWHSCVLDCIPLVRYFQLLTFNFYA